MAEKSLYSKDILSEIIADQQDNSQAHLTKQKLVFGPDGSRTDVTSSTPFPVTDTDTQADLTQIDTDIIAVQGTAGSPTPPRSTLIAGSDGTNTRTAKVDPNGSQYTCLTSPGGSIIALFAPYGNLRVTGEGSTLFFDDFDGGFIDTANRWITATGNSGSLGQSGSVLSISTDSHASAFGSLVSVPYFLRPGFGFVNFGIAFQFEASVVTNTSRFLGTATPGNNTTSNPITDGIGFEITPTGVLRAVIYGGGSVVFSQTLPPLTDGGFHSYFIESRADRTYWFIDNFDTPLATATYKNPFNTQLPILLQSINGPTPPGSSPTYNVMALGLADSSGTTMNIADGMFQWRKAGVDPDGNLLVKPSTDTGAFNSAISAPRMSQVIAQFDLSLAANDITTAVTGTGSATQGSAEMTLSTGTGVTSSASAVSNMSVQWSPGRGLYALFTAAFTTPTSAASEQRMGYYDSNNGFFVGYHGLTFGITKRTAGVDTFIPQSSFDGDPLNGNIATSTFKSNGVPVAANFTLLNTFRLDLGFGGVKKFYIFSPDGNWVLFHTFRDPNSSRTVNTQNRNLPIRAEVIKTASDATNLQLISTFWDGGTVEDTGLYELHYFKSRKYVTANVSAQTASVSVYSVSTGRTLHITGIIVNVTNSSLSVNGLLTINDGVGGTLIIPVSTGTASNQSNSTNQIAINWGEVSLKFTTGVYATVVSGTLRFDVMFVGYEAER